MEDDALRGFGRAMFAAILLMIGGVLGVIYGIAAISNSKFFVNSTRFIFSDLKAWGWITLILGVLELLAAFSLIRGGTFGRLFGITVGSLNAIAALLSIAAYPLWSLAVFALSIWIVYGLAILRHERDDPGHASQPAGDPWHPRSNPERPRDARKHPMSDPVAIAYDDLATARLGEALATASH
jgi:hypothetical protein